MPLPPSTPPLRTPRMSQRRLCAGRGHVCDDWGCLASRTTQKAVKLTVSQVEIGFDILKARDVEPPAEPLSSAGPPNENPTAASSDGATATGADDDRRKRYRLMVKRRLLKRHGEELSTDAPTRKRQLEDLYRDVEAGFLSLGSKIREERGGMIANGTV